MRSVLGIEGVWTAGPNQKRHFFASFLMGCPKKLPLFQISWILSHKKIDIYMYLFTLFWDKTQRFMGHQHDFWDTCNTVNTMPK